MSENQPRVPESGVVALEISDFVAGYGSEPVIEGVHGHLLKGGSLALIGPNGAGKTTLIRSILGLVPVASGQVKVFGATPSEARRRIAYVPQAESLDRDFPVSVLDVVLMGRYRKVGWFRRPGADDRAEAMKALEEVVMADRAKDRFGILSGGQRQRVLLARAIAQNAELLLLDEPFNGVDTTSTDVVLQVLHRLRQNGAAIVMSTHNLAVAHLVCDSACLINRRQYGFGAISDTLTPALLRQTYGDRAVVLAGESTIIATN